VQKEHLHGTTDAGSTPNKEDFGLEVGLIGTDEVWCDDRQDTIPELPHQPLDPIVQEE
jgi:hypothetical protein